MSDTKEAEILPVRTGTADWGDPSKLLPIRTQGDLIAGSPIERVQQATEIANVLAPLIREKKLCSVISGREYVRYEGWTVLGAMLGVFPVVEWTRELHGEHGGWEARVVARTMSGAIVGAAEAQCDRRERNWESRDEFALRSMAQTRAGGKAMRMPLGWIMQLAGYEATPAEEMEAVAVPEQRPKKPPATYISDAQVKRLWALAHDRAGKLEAVSKRDIMLNVLEKHGLVHTATISPQDYDEISKEVTSWEPPAHE